MAAKVYKSPAPPQIDLTALATTAKKILDLLACFSRMRSSSEPNHLLNKVLTKIIIFIHMIETSAVAARIGYQLAADVIILSEGEVEDREFHESLEIMRELSRSGQAITRSVAEGFRDIKQQIYKIADLTKDNQSIVVIPTHTQTLDFLMKDIGTTLVANLNLFSEFSRSVEATAEWWQSIKADLESPNPTLLPSGMEFGDASEKMSKWAEMQQGFQEYYNANVNSEHGRFPELFASSDVC
ncbi:hypothetical protein M413DRAFT_427683 [Hebeloma cylindrosporum]|uniref:Uncharacterized protein n=1 Tax=Hebeloma cylindrosporum TaxID=76867 RepID=A0A0C3BXU2_HEBCY|nr:hypothetical protein M413DRAFT_427683 [Hebeloma cylindrosporum h7]